MDVQAIQQGLADAAATISGLNTAPSIPDAITPPLFAPTELDFTYHRTFGPGGMTEQLFSCGLFVSRGDSATGRAALAGFLTESGPMSILAALEADKTLGGVAGTLIVEGVRGAYRLYSIAGIDYLGATFAVRVWA
jgi:hypothetical protein